MLMSRSLSLTRSRTGLSIVAVLGMIASTVVRADDPPPAPAPPPEKPAVVVPGKLPVVHLLNGGYAPGTLGPIDRPGTLRWDSPSFARPFEFSANAVNAVHWPLPAALPRPEGDFCFELAGGDLVYGALLDLDDRKAVIQTPRMGKVSLDRDKIRRIDRWSNSSDLIYSGPNGLTGWTEVSPRGLFREESGQPISEKPGAILLGQFGLPARALVEFEISWKGKPDFLLALGVGTAEEQKTREEEVRRRAMNGQAAQKLNRTSLENAFRFEVWEGELVAHRETETEADLAPIQPIAAGPGRVHLQAYLDQEKGRMTVLSSSGQPLCDLSVKSKHGEVSPNIWLANLKGDVRLERLRISKWGGDSPREAKADLARIHLNDGSIVYGNVVDFDEKSREFVVKPEAGGEESRVGLDRLASVFLAPSADDARRTLRAVYLDGTRISGELTRIQDDAIWMTVPGLSEPCRLPIDGLRSLVVIRHEPVDKDKDKEVEKGDSGGRLEMDGLLLPGELASTSPDSGTSALAWKPEGSATASALKANASGKVIYKDPPPPKSPNLAQQQQRVRVIQAQPVGVAQGFLRALSSAPPSQSGPPGGRRAIHLRTGDIIPSEITKIDEAGVTFRTTLSDSTFVPNEKVKAVELALGGASVVRLNKSKQERLLTLPRMQKESPPTHLIRAKNGDYLRGRILGMDDKNVQVEVRLETKQVPRDRIARIIWLHPDEVDPTKAPAKPPESKGQARVQAVRSDGIRLTFVPEKFAEGTLSGRSDVLGPCRVSMKQVDQLLIGTAIDQAAAFTTYGPWRLKNAVEPKIAMDEEDGSSGRSPGTESALVGKPAPDFKLGLLNGETFKLSEQKGKVIVLDFWATWCGPCLQAMPQVERVTDEFKDKGVKLIAVNLQEGAPEIKAMLERHKLHPTVALDRDGVVAERYAANAIPQTVIIDKEGNISRLFVGGSPKLGDQIREALNDVLSGAKPAKGPVKE